VAHAIAIDGSADERPATLLNDPLLAVSMAFFVASGFAALIYQSVWSTYLGLVLGHAAYAQALVLSIFMGGMAIGSWLASRIQIRSTRLILAYGIIELLIGLLGLVFHSEFVMLSDFSLNNVLPNTTSATTALIWQWCSGAALVLPQSILLGTTFPILGAACVLQRGTSNSSVLGSLYFSNSIGAAFGALAATFVLMPAMGTPGTLKVAGLLNVLIGIAAIAFAGRARDAAIQPIEAAAPSVSTNGVADTSILKVMLWAAAITGATSFVYEIAWVRMLNLAMGSTQHSFELMLSSFILGLALGGLAVRRWTRKIKDIVRAAALAQIAMGIATLLCLVLYARSFDFIEWLIAASRPSSEGYSLYLFGSAALSLVTVTPAAFFAGMTLPLMTAAVIGNGHGTDKIGKIYAANTLGAIVGVFVTIHVLVPVVGVRLSLIFAALVDVFLGVVLIRMYTQNLARTTYLVSLAATVVAFAFAQTFGAVTPEQQASGVYRGGSARSGTSEDRVVYIRDGKTATISLRDAPNGSRAISTNGKVDASIQMDPARPRTSDEITMAMAASLPLASRNDFKRVAIIGFGSGLTTHTLLGSSSVDHVDTIEIEAEMVMTARAFGQFNARAYEDKRSAIEINDARTFFASGNKQYDLIISEPSNPWVSGVASLFTIEFYDEARRHLTNRGVLLQWVQAYELSDQLLATMISAVLEKFAFVDVYVTNTSDLLLVARQNAEAFPERYDQLRGDAWLNELAQNGLDAPEAYRVRKLADTDGLRAYTRIYGSRPHSDFHPEVSLKGPEARFKNQMTRAMLSLADPPVPLQQMANHRPEIVTSPKLFAGNAEINSPVIRAHLRAELIRDALLSRRMEYVRLQKFPETLSWLPTLLNLSDQCRTGQDLKLWIDSLVNVSSQSLPSLSPEKSDALFSESESGWMLCRDKGTEQWQWLNLMAAIAARDAPKIERIGVALIGMKDSAASSAARQYVLLNVMLARLSQGDYAGVENAESELNLDIGNTGSLPPIRAYVLALADVRAAKGPGK
jgi:spermidine synthase